jgi:hypothetical protein
LKYGPIERITGVRADPFGLRTSACSVVPSDSVMKLWVHVAFAGGHDVSAAAGAAASKPRTPHTAVHRTANQIPCTTPRVARADSLTIKPALPFPLDWTGLKIRRPVGECAGSRVQAVTA